MLGSRILSARFRRFDECVTSDRFVTFDKPVTFVTFVIFDMFDRFDRFDRVDRVAGTPAEAGRLTSLAVALESSPFYCVTP